MSKHNKILNYIWVGSPSSVILEHNNNPTNHDVSAVIKMISIIQKSPLIFSKNYQINFWCLDEYENFYKFVFKSFSIVKIFGIQKYLSNKSLIDIKSGKILKIFNLLFSKSQTDSTYKTRYFVIIKDLLSLAVTYYKGGYTLDTNVFPTEKCTADFPILDNFKVVSIDSDYSDGHVFLLFNKPWCTKKTFTHMFFSSMIKDNYKTKTFMIENNKEVWLMYSPKKHIGIESSLDFYLSYFDINDIKNTYNILIISSVMNGIYSIHKNKIKTLPKNEMYFISEKKGDYSNYIASLEIYKMYYNTHKN